MSGLYGSHTGGRGGHGGGSGRCQGRSTPRTRHTKKTAEDYLFYMGSSKDASYYEITDELVVNHINKTFYGGNNVSEELQTMFKSDTDVWDTTLKIVLTQMQ